MYVLDSTVPLKNVDNRLVELIDRFFLVFGNRQKFRVRYSNPGTADILDARFSEEGCDRIATVQSVERNGHVFFMSSRYTNNARGNVRSKKVDVALSNMKKYVIPYTPEEYPLATSGVRYTVFSNWQHEHSDMFVRMSLSKADLLRDYLAYTQTGKPYATLEMFKDKNTLDTMLDHSDRMEAKPPEINVFIDEHSNATMRKLTSKEPHSLIHFTKLPADVYDNCCMLKLSEPGVFIKDIGFKISSNNFWVYGGT